MNLPAQQSNVWMKATDSDKLEALALMNGLPSRKALSEKSAEVIDASYFIALEGVTRYGLSEAIKAILRGSLNHAFFPSPPELRLQCDKAMEHHEHMAEKIRRRERENADFNRLHSNPPPRTEAGRQRVAALYSKFCRDNEDASARQATEAERAEIRARYGITPESVAGIKDQPFTGQRLGKDSEA